MSSNLPTWPISSYHLFFCLSSISQLQKFRDELKNRSRVLKRLGHIDADGVVQLKGRAACLIDTGDELLVTELMFNGTCTVLFVVLKIFYYFMLNISEVRLDWASQTEVSTCYKIRTDFAELGTHKKEKVHVSLTLSFLPSLKF